MDLIRPVVSGFEKLISTFPFLVELYSRPYREVVENEVKLASITNQDRVLNIGCGAVPFTAIHVLETTRAEVWIQDRDSCALGKAVKCLEKAGHAHRVRIFEGDAAHAVPEGFTVAIVALQASPKDVILRNLMLKMQTGGRLVFRQPSKRFVNNYDRLPEHIPPSGRIAQKMSTFDRSVLFRRSPQLMEGL